MFILIRTIIRWFAQRIAGFLGWKLLTRPQTETYLTNYSKLSLPEERVWLLSVADAVDRTRLVFPAQEVRTSPARVWHISPSRHMTTILPSGVLIVDTNVLCTDYWTHHALLDQLRHRNRPVVQVDTVVAPFGHYQDPFMFGGYYDFLYLIAAKLCRIEKTLPAGFADMAIAYPLLGTTYEMELLSYLGFSPNRIFDSRRVHVQAEHYLSGSGGNWFYPSLTDMDALRDRLAPLIPTSTATPYPLYVSRAGRRRIVNEHELMTMLNRYGFVCMADEPRSLAEQLSLYQGSSFIVGPHGASFANINWCQPGTYLHELCSINYSPDFFRYLAQVRHLSYSISLHGALCQRRFRQALVEDITVSVPALERVVNHLLQDQTR
ncbi:glycosyltransferase family 61 protein (plasmid) [Fibrella sp. ES10-3-2-2]